ncbi:MAG: hypothetical protein JWM88_234 [Verrucomicrobia bacterium]|nr:hypothetical protein [Verrucomicrobiota bacterium]
MLGAGAWSLVVRVENSAVTAAYPSVVHALVFEEGGLLWFYADSDGTQSLSLHLDRLVEEKQDLAPLLRAIDPGFHSFRILPDGPAAPVILGRERLPNGCFIESLAALRERVIRGDRIERPRLLSCYAETPRGLRGHTVLTYRTPQGFFLLDPASSSAPQQLPSSWLENPMAVAETALRGFDVRKARWIPVDVPAVSLVADLNGRLRQVSPEIPATRLIQ